VTIDWIKRWGYFRTLKQELQLSFLFFKLKREKVVLCNRPDRNRRVEFPARFLLWREDFPFKDEIPVKTTSQFCRCSDILETVHTDDIDNRAHNPRPVLHPRKNKISGCDCSITCALLLIPERHGVRGVRANLRYIRNDYQEKWETLLEQFLPPWRAIWPVLRVGNYVWELLFQSASILFRHSLHKWNKICKFIKTKILIIIFKTNRRCWNHLRELFLWWDDADFDWVHWRWCEGELTSLRCEMWWWHSLMANHWDTPHSGTYLMHTILNQN